MPEEQVKEGQDPGTSEQGRGISDEMLYGALDGDDGPAAVDQDVLSQVGQGAADDDAAGTGDQETADPPTPEPGEAAAGDDGAGDAGDDGDEGAGDDEPKAQLNLWDPDRQARDQADANEKKGLKAENAGLKAQLDSIQDQLKEAARKPAEKRTTESDALDDLLGKALPKLEKINLDDPDSTGADDVVSFMRDDLPGLLKAARATGGSAEKVETLEGELKGLRDEIKSREERDTQAAAAKSQTDAQADYDAHIATLDAKVGAGKAHNEAAPMIVKDLNALGYKGDKLPTPEVAKYVADKVYGKLAAKYPSTREANPRKRGTSPRQAPARGAPSATGTFHGSLEDVADDMKRAGKF